MLDMATSSAPAISTQCWTWQLVQPLPHQPNVGYDAGSNSARRKLFDISNQSSGISQSAASNPAHALLGHKRPRHGGPLCSLQSNIRSPRCKKQRARTFSKSSQLTGRTESEVQTTLIRPVTSTKLPQKSDISYSTFLTSSSEIKIAAEATKNYFFLHEACCSTNNKLVDNKTFCGLSLRAYHNHSLQTWCTCPLWICMPTQGRRWRLLCQNCMRSTG